MMKTQYHPHIQRVTLNGVFSLALYIFSREYDIQLCHKIAFMETHIQFGFPGNRFLGPHGPAVDVESSDPPERRRRQGATRTPR